MPEAKISYQRLDHKAHLGFQVECPSLERLYIHAALALTDSLVKLDTIHEKEERHTISVQADDRASLLVQWLNGVLALLESHRFLAKRIYFDGFDGKRIRATLRGEKYDPVRHGHVSPTKPITTSQVDVGQHADPNVGFYARVVVDMKR